MKKYEFIKNSVDDYTLKYKDKEINFKSNVEVINKLQNVVASARMKMIKDLTKEGISIKDLVIEKKENGKTYYDNTNKVELENAYIEEEQERVYLEISKEILGKDITELLLDIGLETEKEGEEFSTTFSSILAGQFPSQETNTEKK